MPTVTEAYATSDATLHALSQRRITWGEANRARDTVSGILEQALNEALNEKRAALVALDNQTPADVFSSIANAGLLRVEDVPYSAP